MKNHRLYEKICSPLNKILDPSLYIKELNPSLNCQKTDLQALPSMKRSTYLAGLAPV